MPSMSADSERPSSRWRVARRRPVVLAIGGLDPSGGAGISMDTAAIVAAGAHACTLVTALTVQSTAGCVDVDPVPVATFRAQLAHLVHAQPPSVVKVGALGSEAVALAVAEFLAQHEGAVVVDPVAAASVTTGSGRSLASEGAQRVLRERIVPRATVLFANGPELAAIAGLPASDLACAALAARAVIARGARSVYAKAGHWETPNADDALVFADATHVFAAPRLDVADVHGTGCALASLAAGRVAVLGGDDDATLVEASRWAKGVLFRALEAPVVVGEGQRVLRIEQG
jgi:hydroxymethylpyrimidine kinase/phosphomethylpyrimidine kinase